MALTYEIDTRLKAIAPVLDEHAEWYSRVLRRVYYPEEYQPNDIHENPHSFQAWLKDAEGGDFIENTTLAQLKKTYAEMTELADEVIRNAINSDQKVGVRAFDNFSTIYESFLMQLRRLERDCVQADSGIDALTGLRSQKAMLHDLEREMERRARRGKPFCLALAQIENLEDVQAAVNSEQYSHILKTVSVQILKCIRSFDDAYRSDEGEFVMALKHTETAGGSAAIARLQRFMDEAALTFEKNGEILPVTLVCCVAEPMPGDEITELLDNMRSDLGRYELDEAPALEYIEKSPLQRLVEAMDDSEAV